MLENIKLPDSLEHIGRAAFYECKKLKEICIPASVHTIEDFAFYGCDELLHIYNHSPNPQPASRIFNKSNITVHVPAGTETSYTECEFWRNFKIVGDIGTIK